MWRAHVFSGPSAAFFFILSSFPREICCHRSCSSPEGYCWEIKQLQTRILVWIFFLLHTRQYHRETNSHIHSEPLLRHGLVTSAVFHKVQEHSKRMCRSPTKIVRAVPKVKKSHPKCFLQKTLEEVTVLLFMRRSTVVTMKTARDEGICPQLLV